MMTKAEAKGGGGFFKTESMSEEVPMIEDEDQTKGHLVGAYKTYN